VKRSWIDSHVHLDTFEEAGELDAVLARAASAGVGRMVAIGGTPAANERAVRLVAAHPLSLRASVGYDRDEALKALDPVPVLRMAALPGVVAIGETGLDYHYGPETAAEQCTLFGQMLEIAAERSLPVVVHSREADDDTVAMLRDHAARFRGDRSRLGVLHCFTGSLAFARRLLDLGYHISFSGIVTFRNAADLREVARAVPEDRLLIETDAPYLAPVPHRGQRNEPAYVVQVGEMLAQLRGVEIDRVAEITVRNAAKLFTWEADA
jgi:TatD DNase family protein